MKVAGKMEKICKDCKHFKIKGTMMGDHQWGLCSRFGYSDTWGSCKDNKVFRWGDDNCIEFESKDKSVESHKSAESPLN